MVVELVGPVVDDAGVVGRTIADTLTRAGLDLLPGALDQVSGMAPAHALRTLAEGHGRFELVEDIARLLRQAEPSLSAWAEAGPAREVDGAGATWHQWGSRGLSRAMLTNLPLPAAKRLAARIGIVVADEEWLPASDERGLPHPDHLQAHLAGRVAPGEAVALVQSIGAALGAASTGCRVVAVGERGGAAMFADAQVATIGDW